jgi:dual specificity tyrosine-phosphorylation-regulated kinase 2/3/4
MVALKVIKNKKKYYY